MINMLKLHLFPLVWSLLDSLTNAVCYLVWVFLHDLDFLLWQTLKRRGKPIRAQRYTGFTHSSRECSSSPAGSLGEENLRGESSDPAALQPLVWTWEQVLPLF